MNTENKIAVLDDLFGMTKKVSALYEEDEDELYQKLFQGLGAKVAKVIKSLEERDAPMDKLMMNMIKTDGSDSVNQGRIITPREVLASKNN